MLLFYFYKLKNRRLKDTLISFLLSMIYPFGLNLMPGIFRIPALRSSKTNKKCLYNFSNIVAFI